MPRVTIFLSRLIGLFSLLVAFAMLVQRQAMIETASQIVHDRPLLLVLGMITSICGLAMVLGQNVWSGGALPIVVTLFGWTVLIRGALILFLSTSLTGLFEMLHFERFFYLFVVITLVLGVYLTYGGFKRPLASNPATRG